MTVVRLLSVLVLLLLTACASTHSKIYSTPQNPGFEMVEIEGLPAKWHGPKDGANTGCYYLVSHEEPATGYHCLLIQSQESCGSARADWKTRQSGFVQQSVDARPFRGKTACLRAAVKIHSGRARLFLRIFGPTEELFNDSMNDCPVISRYWAYYEIRCPVVPRDAYRLEFGAYVEPNSKVWFDDFMLVAMVPLNEER